MVVFIEDPNRMKETMDALVIAPELAKSCGLIEHKAVVGPPNARRLAVTYGFKRWPALVFFRDGKYLGAVDGLRLWADLVREADEIMHSEPHYPPSVGIPVFLAQHATGCCCRGCFFKWHHISAGRALTKEEQEYAVEIGRAHV